MNTISSEISGFLPRPGSFGTSMTEEQKSAAEEILSKYDPENLSEEDANAIKEELREAGIKPSRELGTLIEESGFDPEQFRPAGPPPGGPGGPGKPGGSENLVSEEGLKTLAEILEEYDVENLSEDDLTAIQAKLTEAGFYGQGSVVDLGA